MAKRDTSNIGITPLGDRALIKMLDESDQEKKSASGIIIPATAKEEKPDRGKVVAVGKGKVDDNGKVRPLQVKEGDKVIFQWGDKLSIDNEEYYLVSESNILAIIK